MSWGPPLAFASKLTMRSAMASSLPDPALRDALQSRLDTARELATEAAALLMAYRADLAHMAVHKKGAVDLVTAADEACERKVLGSLAAAFPNDLIIGEEGGGHGPADARLVWFIDPLDGTTNFVSGLSHFCVSLGLAARDPFTSALEPVLGVIAAPALVLPGATMPGALWSGALSLGATRETFAATLTTRLACSPATTLEAALAATGFPYDRQRTADDLVRPLAPALKRVLCIRRLGSAALDLAGVADGTFGLYWEPRLKPWDFVAGAALVLEAGGRVTDLQGGPGYMDSCNVFASNGHLHERFLAEVLAADPGPPT